MANTTVKGALAIHGQNPQVCIYILMFLRCLINAVSSRNCNSKPDMGVGILEGALFCIDRCVRRSNVREVY